MSRGTLYGTWRPLVVWAAATVAAALTATLAWSPAAAVSGPWSSSVSFADALVRLSALALLMAAARLWIITTITVAQLLRGRAARPGGGAIRRLVLAACGAGLAAAATVPASAAEGEHELLSGLRLPDRAVSSSQAATQAPSARPTSSRAALPGGVHVVVPGDSLWSIAAARTPAGRDLDKAWRAIWAANRDVVGDDPHLILPGQSLRLPAGGTGAGTADESTASTTDETGDRP